jgi:hypothetical protein
LSYGREKIRDRGVCHFKTYQFKAVLFLNVFFMIVPILITLAVKTNLEFEVIYVIFHFPE